MENKIYEPPKSELVESDTIQKPLASRWSRLFACIIDTIILLIFILPIMYFTGGFEGFEEATEPSILYELAMGVFSIVMFCLINVQLLLNHGQTVGKKILNIRIVSFDNANKASGEQLLRRYSIYFLLGLLPVIGSLLDLINILFIFGAEKRCGHDLVAGTKVIES